MLTDLGEGAWAGAHADVGEVVGAGAHVDLGEEVGAGLHGAFNCDGMRLARRC